MKKLTGGSNGASSGDPGAENESLSLSAFSSLLSDNMKDRFFPKGNIVYREGEIGNSMLFVNSGKLEVTTRDGYKVEVSAGNFVGEGALVSPERTRNATVSDVGIFKIASGRYFLGCPANFVCLGEVRYSCARYRDFS